MENLNRSCVHSFGVRGWDSLFKLPDRPDCGPKYLSVLVTWVCPERPVDNIVFTSLEHGWEQVGRLIRPEAVVGLLKGEIKGHHRQVSIPAL